MSEPDYETQTLRTHPVVRTPAPAGRSMLWVFEGDVSRLEPLPDFGEVVIGRSADAQVRLADPTASRRHACLTLTPHEVRIRDLESHNGTFVNGEAVTLPRVLLSGDSISICGSTLILHHQQSPPPLRSFLDSSQLRQRLAEEIDRTLCYQRPLLLLVVDFSGQKIDQAAIQRALGKELPSIALPAWESQTQLAILAPELSVEALPEYTTRLLQALAPIAAEARIGYALCPADARDGDALLAGARAAAQKARPGQVLSCALVKTVQKVGREEVILVDPAMQGAFALVERLAQSDIPVLVTGETGTGKELIARALHQFSRRQRGPLISVNCATLTESLAESQLFGHLRGAFTGAVSDKRGLLENANSGAVFFDELGELDLRVQAKLLRAIETRHIQPVGATGERPFDARIIAATNRDLLEEVRAGRFREDLYYRINAAVIALPPLRARKRELPVLARAFLEAACQRLQRKPLTLSDAVMERLLGLSWPGNVRQLKNEMEFLAATVDDPVVESWHLSPLLSDGSEAAPHDRPPPLAAATRPQRPSLPEEIRQLERQRIREAMNATGGVVKAASALLGMPWRTVYEKLKQHGLQPRDPDPTFKPSTDRAPT